MKPLTDTTDPIKKKRGRKKKEKDYVELCKEVFTSIKIEMDYIFEIPKHIIDTIDPVKPYTKDNITETHRFDTEPGVGIHTREIFSMSKERAFITNVYTLVSCYQNENINKYIEHNVYNTRIQCWHCCNTFDNVPYFIPVNYNERKGLFKVQGNFCSYNCVLTYIHNCKKYNYLYIKSLLAFLIKICHKQNLSDIIPAPHRETLQQFGGFLSIDDFRKNNRLFEYQRYPVIHILDTVKTTQQK
jgi:hypothetical protein